MDNIIDFESERKLLHQRLKELQDFSEADAQRIHDLKRKLDVSNAENAYLLQEMESLSTIPEQTASKQRDRVDLEEMRRKHDSLRSELNSLQCEFNSVSKENNDLREQLKTATQGMNVLSSSGNASKEENECQKNHIEHVELENLELLRQLDETKETYLDAIAENGHLQKIINDLKEELNCMNENLGSKRIELEEKSQLLESAQEQLSDISIQLATLTAAPTADEHKKGNSLFAEVDDQRQVMKELLAAQKRSYLEMKKIFNGSQEEIRQLKRENVSIRTELQTCVSLFHNSDKIYQDTLNERICQLVAQNEDLEKNLKLMNERFQDLAERKEVGWIDSIFTYCKKETIELKQQLQSARLQKGSLEEQLRDAKQDIARWRFKALQTQHFPSDCENIMKAHDETESCINLQLNEGRQNRNNDITSDQLITEISEISVKRELFEETNTANTSLIDATKSEESLMVCNDDTLQVEATAQANTDNEFKSGSILRKNTNLLTSPSDKNVRFALIERTTPLSKHNFKNDDCKTNLIQPTNDDDILNNKSEKKENIKPIKAKPIILRRCILNAKRLN